MKTDSKLLNFQITESLGDFRYVLLFESLGDFRYQWLMPTAVCVAMFGVRMLAHYPFDLANRHDWQEATEQQKQGGEQSKAADEHTYINPGRCKVSPARR